MIFAPLKGYRHIKVTDRRTAIDFAHLLKDLVEDHFADAEKIVLVTDNLITHKPTCLYEALNGTTHRSMAVGSIWPKSKM